MVLTPAEEGVAARMWEQEIRSHVLVESRIVSTMMMLSLPKSL